jgi:hypothetical protein
MSHTDLAPAAPPALPLAVAADLQDDLMAASNDLDRLQRLLSDACDTLMARFTDAIGAIGHIAPAQDGRADALRAELGGAVVALQFQDMASQLIAHTGRRLRACADKIASEALGDDEDGPGVEVSAPLRPNPVTQDEMDAGSIELF